MFNANNLSQAMKQMGMDMDEIDAEKVEVHLSGDKKLVFNKPQISKIEAQGQEIFQLQGKYTEKEEINAEDVEIVMQKTDCSEEQAQEALKNAEDVAEAVMNLQ